MKYSRRKFIKTGLIFVPTWFVTSGIGGSVSLSNLDPEVYSWMNRVKTNSGNYTSLSVVANDTWIKMIKSFGLRSKCLRKNTYTGLNLSTCIIPLIVDWGNSVDSNQNFVAGNYSESTGLTGDGLTKYLGTSCNPNSGSWSSVDDCVAEVYVRTKNTVAGCYLGASNGSTNNLYLYSAAAGNLSYVAMFSTVTQISYSDSIGTGHYVGSRIASNDLQLYRNGVTKVSTATPQGTFPNSQIFVHCYSFNSNPSAYVTSILGGYGLWKGLTSAQVANLYLAEQRLQTILGRQV